MPLRENLVVDDKNNREFISRNYRSDSPGEGYSLICRGYIGMWVPKGYSFSAVLVINNVLIEADFGHFGHK